jgi:hypothetical protein
MSVITMPESTAEALHPRLTVRLYRPLQYFLCRIGLHYWRDVSRTKLDSGFEWEIMQKCSRCPVTRTRTWDEWDQMTGI